MWLTRLLYRGPSGTGKPHHKLSACKSVVGEKLEGAHNFHSRMGAVPAESACIDREDEPVVYVQHTCTEVSEV